jgi:hypothetical protein
LLRLAAWSLGSVVFLYACLSPTQITARLSTDVPCDTIATTGTSIYDADPTKGPITTTRACTESGALHDIGTLVITPSGDSDGALTVVAVAGVQRPSEECAANDYKGCIVARRRMRFYPHEPLDLPIELLRACLDVPCDQDKTCFRGACIGAEVEPIHGCLGPDCEPQSDAAAPDTGGADAGASDGTSPDAPIATDAELGGWQLALDMNGRKVRGLATDGANLWWTQDSANPPSVSDTYSATMGAFNSRTLQHQYNLVAYGIAANPAGEFLIALQSGAQCALIVSPSPWEYTCQNSPGVGVAALWNVPPTVWVTTPNVAFRYIGPAEDFTPTGGGYVESDADGAWFVSGQNIMKVDWSAPSPTASLASAALPRAGWGFAMNATHWFVSTTDGVIYAVNRASGTLTPPISAPGILTEVEDILYDAGTGGTGTLYAAAVHGNTTGIFSRSLSLADLL